mmetsp:Transcript_9784/g.32172  ORF Transcript_9784/g.32172 Transcript_9784/m.32172 type:complete len:211 (+) Transcript_9784:629-1261(+)
MGAIPPRPLRAADGKGVSHQVSTTGSRLDHLLPRVSRVLVCRPSEFNARRWRPNARGPSRSGGSSAACAESRPSSAFGARAAPHASYFLTKHSSDKSDATGRSSSKSIVSRKYLHWSVCRKIPSSGHVPSVSTLPTRASRSSSASGATAISQRVSVHGRMIPALAVGPRTRTFPRSPTRSKQTRPESRTEVGANTGRGRSTTVADSSRIS